MLFGEIQLAESELCKSRGLTVIATYIILIYNVL